MQFKKIINILRYYLIFNHSFTFLQQTIGAWRVIFFVTIVLFCIEFLVFVIFGSGEEQPWNKMSQKSDPEKPQQDENTPLKAENKTNAS